jgi:ABC-type dipeptide/oligopeptide/nickel transport system ATPase subunit
MNDHAARKFEDAPAVRGHTHLLYGLIGPSGSGKTYSALRLATGMQRVCGGDIFVVDTENGRAKHYAEYFKFREVPFSAPFSSLDYIDVVNYCLSKGAATIIIDSLSHEHSGQGGALEWHEEEVRRLMKAWNVNEDKANIPAWGKPKAARRKLINVLTQADVNIIACVRAKDKIKIGGGKVVQLGWMPDAGEEFVFELAAKSLLLPGAGGVPTWQSDQPGEKMMIKLPEYFRSIFSGRDGKPLDEEVGQKLAEWSVGPKVEPTKPLTTEQVEALVDALDVDSLEKLEAAYHVGREACKKANDKAARDRLRAVYDVMKGAMKGAQREVIV